MPPSDPTGVSAPRTDTAEMDSKRRLNPDPPSSLTNATDQARSGAITAVEGLGVAVPGDGDQGGAADQREHEAQAGDPT